MQLTSNDSSAGEAGTPHLLISISSSTCLLRVFCWIRTDVCGGSMCRLSAESKGGSLRRPPTYAIPIIDR